ncbi:MAG: ParB/RepB/Spo0J family partition protein [Hoeflea sp.]|uniref:ParB/RepB/Spo0J family partition protein n=1 Tax=Hoeflea sp. TaxID=1940281 RepID=UPI001DAE1476|nr:ParB/RepB/Spo0J family partition protein [Hoeflea sp.]MBU4527501.1 ParB/RepB/Spo0J family partition protein [Alphaproteobacteria bacterium]MBU4543945.1 ParB/RepB/Spo0J family partition protein [Alphaproteobacteria bacterium]MBU4552365.1 ParB/RepB/Spo0J family partition protein [Alphaproteobacteria bacterium]MBV1726004.1 ParB/RepB/Spo0J family partition protein [Hoeflea sp.]MBV1782362.1 ParB/RepB/Spo0J family partition protein [Hoeflea sp.]
MHIIKIDPRALKENPDDARKSKSTPQGDALLAATIKAVGIIQPPVVSPEADGGNGYIIQAGHRRTRGAIAAELEEIEVIVTDPADDGGAMRSMVENIAREPLNPVDQWRAIERLVALGWTEEGIAAALSLSVRQIKKLRLLANVLPAMLDQMAKGDMPDERQLRTIAAASIVEQKEVWKIHKPKKNEATSWWSVANGLSKTRMYARDASFDDELTQAYGIAWVEDLFAPADEDSRYTTDVEAFLGAQQEWMTNNLPKNGMITELNGWNGPELPRKAERVYGKPKKSDHTAMYLDRDGKVQSVVYRMPEPEAAKGNAGDAGTVAPAQRPDVTQKGQDMIGDFRTDALHEALQRAPIEDDTLMALLVIAFAGQNVRVDTGSGNTGSFRSQIAPHAATLVDGTGNLAFDKDTLRIAVRSVLIEVLSCRRNMSNSGIVSRIAGAVVGADSFLPNMGTEDFLLCLSRQALEGACVDTSVLPRNKVRDTRAVLVEHFKEERFVHASAHFAPEATELADWKARNELSQDEDAGDADGSFDEPETDESDPDAVSEGFREAAE